LNRLYIGNLEWGVTTGQLREIFSEIGEVIDAIVITDRETRRSKGFGFVTFKNPEDAKKAIERFNGVALNRRNIVVKEARPPKSKEKRRY